MAKSFIRKNAMKNSGSKVIGAVARGVGAVGAAYASNATPLKDKFPKYHGLAFLALGLAGEIFLEDEKLQALSQGVSTYGTLNVASRLALPESAADFGQTPAPSEEQLGEVSYIPGTPSRGGLTLKDMANIADANNAADEVANRLLNEYGVDGVPVPDLAYEVQVNDVADGLTS